MPPHEALAAQEALGRPRRSPHRRWRKAPRQGETEGVDQGAQNASAMHNPRCAALGPAARHRAHNRPSGDEWEGQALQAQP
mmetsp:Transcript_26209/g.69614  ORF Transcript_26209/g.69614 Transcript_26209/m.69614 type:complete len:81 (+) Transcript_26209:306-548(+)